METVKNYIGQLRIYSMIDLILLLYISGVDTPNFLGSIILHVAFLSYLEAQHKDNGRKKIPHIVWLILMFVGVFFYQNTLSVTGYIISSFFYTLKKKGFWGKYSPIMRGLQNFFIIGGIVGFLNPLSIVSFVALSLRNLTGDFRDVTKDRSEHVRTIPVLLGIKKDCKKIHLLAIFMTTLLWWSFSELPMLVLLMSYYIQSVTYNLTPR
jgi:4-hydroxybenzoate polyprenyltransferase